MENSEVKVVAPRDGSPAASADIKPGDLIFSIDKEPTYDLTLPEVEQKLRGPAGSEVALMLRRGTGKPLDDQDQARRRHVPDRHPSAGGRRYRLYPPGRLRRRDARFARRCGQGFAPAGRQQADRLHPRSAQQSGRQLRCGGQGGRRTLSTRATSPSSRAASRTAKHIAATPGDVANGQPIVALVNGGTAREAELVAGALQDDKRAVLLGSKTFGESAIETLIPLNGNGAIRLTTARFLTPSRPYDPGNRARTRPHRVAAQAGEGRRGRPAARGGPARRAEEPGCPDRRSQDRPRPAARRRTDGHHGGAAQRRSADRRQRRYRHNSDEQLSEAEDVLRGLALVAARPRRARNLN